MKPARARIGKAAVTAATAVLPALVLVSSATAARAPASFRGETPAAIFAVHTILSGATLSHSFVPSGGSGRESAPLSNPDDITLLGRDIFVGFQNGVGPQGQASSDGNLDSTVVELNENGDPLAKWDVKGKTDGVTADPQAGLVIATVNEDANSSLYTIDPTASPGAGVKHYRYNEPLPHLGGTDAISIYEGQILISASAPGTTGAPAPQPTYPAVYEVSLDPATSVATVTPLFYDEATAIVADRNSPDYGQPSTLMLTDPDSNEVVPAGARFGRDFMLTSQGDLEQIYVGDAGGRHQSLAVLTLTQSVDDTAWPTTSRGTLYSTDSTNDTVDTVTGPFRADRPVVVATPCGANSAPPTCPAPPQYPANYLATLNPFTGAVTKVATEGALYTAQGGLLFIAGCQTGASIPPEHPATSRPRSSQ